jgi:FkbM family methyltransferase
VAGRLPYFGTRVYFPRHALIVRIVCADGIFEADIVRRMVTLARPGTTVFDVGANLGFTSIPVLRDCPDCRVVSFEPSPSSLPFLQQTAAGSRYRDRWMIVGRALSSFSGEQEFAVGGAADALFEGFKSHDRLAGARVVTVPVSTLDDEWRRLGEPEVSVVKIDVEGAEGAVLAGAAALLERWHPTLIVEWYKPHLDRFGTPASELMRVAGRFRYHVLSVPGGTPIADETALQVQMLESQNFLLVAGPDQTP